MDSDTSGGSRMKLGKRKRKAEECPYMDTIQRSFLDFDLEKQCSVSLKALNVYSCLVCGLFFQGRSMKSPAMLHSLQAEHHLFINLRTAAVYCLPDDYEVEDPSLDDIKYALFPSYTEEDVAEIDRNTKQSVTLDGKFFLPGVVGLNVQKANEGVCAVLQVMSRIALLRNFFLLKKERSLFLANKRIKSSKNKNNTASQSAIDTNEITDLESHNMSRLVTNFGELIRKMWNKRNYKKQVSPQEIMQAIIDESKRNFLIAKHCDVVEFLSWFLNRLHYHLRIKKTKTSIIYDCFQGQVEIKTFKKAKDGKSEEDEHKHPLLVGYEEASVSTLPFLLLSLEVPPTPLFKNESEKNQHHQVPLLALLQKFNGESIHHITTSGERKQYRIKKLPRYLIIQLKRFMRNYYQTEKNSTIVQFPIRALDMGEYMMEEDKPAITKYDLVANIRHEGDPATGEYKVDVHHKGTNEWFEMHDLTIEKNMPELIAQSESYVLVYELRTKSKNAKNKKQPNNTNNNNTST